MNTAERSLDRLALRCIGVAILCCIHGWLVLDTLKRKSPTVDEIAHLPAGKSFLEKQDFRVYHHNPPLARAMAAFATSLPVTYGEAYRRRPASHWGFAWDCLLLNSATEADRNAYLENFTRGRMVIALWSVLTLPVVFWWACWWFGGFSGWTAAILYCFSPNIITHAGMVTTDLPATSTMLMACFAFARWLDGPIWTRAVIAGILLGVALLTKFSAMWLIIIFPLWAILHPLFAGKSLQELANRLIPWRLLHTRVGLQFLGILFHAWLVVNVGYLFQGRQIVTNSGYYYAAGFTSLGEFPFVSNSLTRPRLESEPPSPIDINDDRYHNAVRSQRINRFRGTALGPFPSMAPYEFVAGFDDQKMEAEGKYQMYFNGELRHGNPENKGRQGWWYYYFATLGLKLPLGTLVLITLGIIGALVWSDISLGRFAVIFGLAAVPILAMSFLTDINLGLRYVLPSLPFLFIIAGSAVRFGRSPNWIVLAIVALVWNIVVEIRQHPNELTYFNEFAGGPENGRRWLIDSNIDWGQDLRSLVRWLEKNPEWKEARIAYWGSLPMWFEAPENWRPVPPPRLKPDPNRRDTALWPGESWDDPLTFGPQPGKFIVSVNFERGHEHHSTVPPQWLEKLPADQRAPFSEGGTNNLLLRVPRNSYTYFQHFKPRIFPDAGYSLLFFDISLDDANRVREELGLPRLPSP